ncbi:ACP S-malonyltransferase [uncultured Cardiobacterium sp.]|uniref:ACP S-malonyltransferase n=1 Tax=uncultured Cardiobacterium sp. TaxID=417619 RepID=UPI002601CCE5|nr:ACP S-malonyltransferase [uncultured Cardiobacterium sp.]
MTTIALIFPGQGSQSAGMLKELAAVYPVIQRRFAEASEVLGLDLWHIAQENPNGQLDQTAITQPALLAAGVACADILRDTCGVNAACMAGHSLGEYTALCAAGAMTFAEAVQLVHMRGRIMQDAVAPGEGAMAAILGLDDEDVVAVCNRTPGKVSAANFNSPGQVVIAGEAKAVAAAIEAAKQAGAKRAIPLAVSVPSHCELMRAAAAQLGLHLNKIHWQTPGATIIHNVDAKPRDSATGIEAALGAQLYQPVRWVDCIKALAARGVDLFIEAGPGKVLTGLNKRIDKNLRTIAFDHPDSVAAVQQALETA